MSVPLGGLKEGPGGAKSPTLIAVTVLTLSAGLSTAVHGQVPEWKLETVWQIGHADRPGYDLSRISGLAVDRAGNLFVGQPQESAVRMFDASGRFVRRIAGRGRGPGEVESVTDVFVRPGGIYIVDQSQLRLMRYNSMGKYIEQWSAADLRAPALSRSVPEQILSNGALVGVAARDTTAFDVYLSKGKYPRPIASLPYQTGYARLALGRLRMVLQRPVNWQPFWGAVPDGNGLIIVSQPMAQADQPAYFNVLRFDINGDTVFDRRFQYTPHLASAAVWDSLVRERIGDAIPMVSRMGGNSAELSKMLKAEYGERGVLPPITKLVVSSNGSQWLGLSGAGQSPATWLVLDSQARRIAQVKLPSTHVIESVDDAYAYVSTQDADDIPIIMKMRINRNRPKR